ncbi:MAG: hypothetical protein ACJ76J_29930 [Thermoanaerobaculia bacterium]
MSQQDATRLFDLIEELIEAIEEEDTQVRKRKLATVKEKVRRERPTPSIFREIS